MDGLSQKARFLVKNPLPYQYFLLKNMQNAAQNPVYYLKVWTDCHTFKLKLWTDCHKKKTENLLCDFLSIVYKI